MSDRQNSLENLSAWLPATLSPAYLQDSTAKPPAAAHQQTSTLVKREIHYCTGASMLDSASFICYIRFLKVAVRHNPELFDYLDRG